MCGIAGIALLDNGRSIQPEWIALMCDRLAHRGPDDSGIHIDGNIALGSRRLAIQDTSQAGHMPMVSPDGKVVISLNGEIYNFREIRENLEKSSGTRFRSNTDTEVVLTAYLEYDLNFVDHLNGMFAIAIWDSRCNRLVLVRDRVGIKPLYYYLDDKILLFASELQAILAPPIPGLNLEIDREALNQYLIFGNYPSPFTPFSKVRKLSPGELLTLEAGSLKRHTYWSASFVPNDSIKMGDAVDHLEELIESAVQYRLISDVPVGTFLSGGIDSSVISAFAAKNVSGTLKTFSIGHVDPKHDESKFSRLISTYLGTDHHELTVDEGPHPEKFVDIMGRFNEPFYDYSGVPTYLVSELARKDVTVCLSGDGGDELFFGYRHLARLANSYDRRNICAQGNKLPIVGLLKLLGPGVNRYLFHGLKHTIGLENSLTRAIEHFHYYRPYKDWAEYITKVHGHMNFGDRCALLGGFDGMGDEADYLRECISSSDSREAIPFLSGIEFRNYLQNDILTKVDRMSMQHSLEVRVPLLDHRIVEFAASLPSSMKSQKGGQKVILRKLCERLYPDPSVHRSFSRPKHGFGFPWLRYIKGPLREYIEDGFGNSRFQSDLGLDPHAVNHLLESFDRDAGYRNVWLVFCLLVWWDRNIDSGRSV